MSGSMKVYGVVVLGALVTGAIATAQTASTGCALRKQVYTCDWAAFKDKLDGAHNVAVETQSRLDRPVATELRELAQSLGKSVTESQQGADLTFLLIPWEGNGVEFGPMDQPLATLRIYAPDQETGHRKLVWVETYFGQPDMPWPAEANAAIEQFRERLRKP
jgi:hypothetical protein